MTALAPGDDRPICGRSRAAIGVIVAVRAVGEPEIPFDRTGRTHAHRSGHNRAGFKEHDRGDGKDPIPLCHLWAVVDVDLDEANAAVQLDG